ncbi:MAG TPA: hypothetical protein VF023_03910 [Bryobacteraceae bacterium]
MVDLSHTPHEEKLDYLRTLLPSLAKIRRLTGLPHRIVLDEAHYFLHERSASEMLDLELNGYTLVTYRASTLCPEILQSSEAVLVTRESDPKEVRGLLSLCRACAGGQSEEEWQAILGGLILGEALVLPITKEAEGRMRRIRLAPRLTPHVRHFAKYIDIPVPEARAFVFWRDRTPAGLLARTMREFVAVLEHAGPEIFDGHLRRHDSPGGLPKFLEIIPSLPKSEPRRALTARTAGLMFVASSARLFAPGTNLLPTPGKSA